MSSSSGARKGNNGMKDIPSGSRKTVESLKEIVNSPEAEIYAMLKECDMDPNEAVHRLLSQDLLTREMTTRQKMTEEEECRR